MRKPFFVKTITQSLDLCNKLFSIAHHTKYPNPFQHNRLFTRVTQFLFPFMCIFVIRHLLSTYATKTLVSAFVFLHLDYCNSLLFGCPQYLLNKLQKVQNNATRLVLRVSKTNHISPHLASLHWLPIDSRIQYKLSSL